MTKSENMQIWGKSIKRGILSKVGEENIQVGCRKGGKEMCLRQRKGKEAEWGTGLPLSPPFVHMCTSISFFYFKGIVELE